MKGGLARATSVVALGVTAVASGAVAGLIACSFIWLVQELIELLWTDLPDAVGVDPFGSWWLFAVPIAGGLLVGLGQRFLGNHPESIERSLQRWQSGGQIDPATMPATGFNTLTALVTGGPVGFEAALIGLIGGFATWIGVWLHSAGALVRQAWGAQRVDSLPKPLRTLPVWLTVASGVLTYRALPFGGIDVTFRFGPYSGELTVADALVAFGFAAAVTVPLLAALTVVRRAEDATWFRRHPELIGMAGGVLIATLAIEDDFVLFSGQQAIQNLGGLDTGALLYLSVAKWAALCIALFAGWRGGPVFPTFLAVASLAAALDGPLGADPAILMVAGIAAVSMAFVRGRIALALILSLYAVPLSYAVVLVVGSLGAAVTLAVARSAGLVAATAD